MNQQELESRTRDFALRVMRFVANLDRSRISEVVGHQLLKSGTSMGANYREANRAESHDDFIHKIGIVAKESAETQYWLELFEAAGLGSAIERAAMLKESGELLAIFTSIGKTARANKGKELR